MSAPAAKQQQAFILSFNRFDILRIAPTEPALEKAIVETINASWSGGLQATTHKQNDKVAEFKLSGSPWQLGGIADPHPKCAELLIALLRALARVGFHVKTSIDMSRQEDDTSAVLLRRGPREDLTASGALFGLWLAGSDSFLAYGAPSDLVDEGFESIIKAHWSRGLQKKSPSEFNATRFKLHGNFVAAEGDAAVEARLFMANLHEELLARGFECIASLDPAKSKYFQDFMIFRRVNTATSTPH